MKCFSPKILEISNPTRVWAVLLAVVLLVLPLLLLAAPNPQVNYQGKLTDPLGVAVTDGGHTMVFRLYTVPTGGTAIWTETRSGGNQVQTIDGLFSVMLGSVSSLSGVNFGQTLYLGVTVGADGEMTPRRVLGTVPAAFETFQLGGVASSSFLRSDQADTMTAFLTLTGGASADNLLVSGTATTAALAVGVDRITDLTGAGLSVVGNALTANIASGQIVDDTITTADISYALTLAGNPVLNANEVFFGTNGLIFESTAADNFEGLLDASALTADRTWTLPNTTGAIALTTSAMTGTFDGNDFAGGAIGTGDLLYGSAAGSISELAIGTNGRVLSVVGGLPAWVATSTLGIGGGGSSLFTDGGSTTYLTSTSDNLNIGASSATSFKLHVNGAIAQFGDRILFNADAAGVAGGSQSLFVGNGGQSIASGGYYNSSVGINALAALTTGYRNTAIGNYALSTVTTGGDNTALGSYALGNASSTVGGSIAIGTYAAENQSAQNVCCVIAIGNSALRAGTGEYAYGTIAIGHGAMEFASPTYGSSIALGSGVLRSTTGVNNVGIGQEALYNNTTGGSNIAIGGRNVLSSNTTGGSNISIGDYSMQYNVTGDGNVGIGHHVLRNASSTSNNTAVGLTAGNDLVSGFGNNTFLGYNTGRGIVTGARNTIIGANVTGLSSSLSNSIILADGAGNQRLFIDSSGNAGIGTTTPTQRLHIQGNARLTGALYDSTNSAGTAGYVLQTTATGVQWVATSTLGIGGGGSSLFTDGGSTTYLTSTGDNLAIGATTTTFKLDVNGAIAQGGQRLLYNADALDSYEGTLFVGNGGQSLDGASWPNGRHNTGVGVDSLLSITTGRGNTALGFDTLGSLTTGNYNTAIGNNALGNAGSGIDGIIAIGLEAAENQSASNTSGIIAIGNRALRAGAGEFTYGTIAIGDNAMRYGSPSYAAPIAIGNNALANNQANNVAIGFDSMLNTTTGDLNIAIGAETLYDNVTGNSNIALGWQALSDNTTGGGNTAIGTRALWRNITGSNNIGIGDGVLDKATSTTHTIAMGQYSLFNTTNSYGNIGLGTYTLNQTTTGNNNIAIGMLSLRNNTTGSNNIGFAENALENTTTGSDNIAFGVNALRSNSTGSRSIAIGADAGRDATATGNAQNIFLGYNTGRGITTGTNNTIIGANVTGLASTTSNNIILADGAGNQRLRIDASGNVGIGTTTPTQRLHIQGNARLTGALYDSSNSAGTAGYVLQTTATGVQWVATSTLGIGGGGSSLFTDGGTTTYLTSTGDNLAVGTTSTAFKLGVQGVMGMGGRQVLRNADMFSTNNDSVNSLFVGDGGQSVGTGWENGNNSTGVGFGALYSLTTGGNNTAVGAQALQDGTTTEQNVAIGTRAMRQYNGLGDAIAIGYEALENVTGGFGPIAIGSRALRNGGGSLAIGTNALSSVTSAYYNFAIGLEALRYTTTGTENYAIGDGALTNNTTGSNNLGIGLGVLSQNISGNNNLAIGNNALLTATSSSNNFAIGLAALENSVASNNFALGRNALNDNTTGYDNMAIGEDVLGLSTTGNNNTVVGQRAGGSVTTGGDNTFLGTRAGGGESWMGWGVTTGSGNIAIGREAMVASATANNQLSIGNLIYGTGLDGTGTSLSSGNIGIGTTTPTQRLHIQGNARLTGALYDSANSAGTNGYVLQTTATGVQWVATSTLGIGGGGSSLFTDGGSTTYLTSTSDNLAVGTSTQIGGARLSVAGNVSVSELNGYYIGTKRMLSVYDGPFVELNNVFVGSEASSIDTATAYQNTVVGAAALEDLTTGRFNTAIGTFALSNATSTEGNTAVGAMTLSNLQSGMGNTAIGSTALHANESGSDNIAIGVSALYNKTSGDRNIAIGVSALLNDISGSRSIAIGFEAGADSTTTGNAQNIFLGYNTGRGITTGTNNTIIGGNVTGLVSTTSNNIILADGAGNQRLRIDASGNVGIGTTTPTAQLHTTGSVRFENFGAGTLQTDASGNVSVSSDERLKKVVGGYEAGLDEILAIEPIQYHWRKETGFDTEGLYTGFSAQNVKDALPEAVGEDKHGFLTLSDRPILAAVVNAIKELWQRMTETESRVDALEAEVAALRAALEASGSGGSYVPPPPPPEEEPNDDTVDEDVVEGEDESGSGDTSDAGESDSPVDDESVEDTAADEPVVDDESGEDAETVEDAGSPEPETGV